MRSLAVSVRSSASSRIVTSRSCGPSSVSSVGAQTSTIYEWAGGRDAFARWLNRFYDLVETESPSIAAMFGGKISDEHREHATDWWAEVVGGPAVYTEQRGSYEHMLARHHARRGVRRGAAATNPAERSGRPQPAGHADKPPVQRAATPGDLLRFARERRLRGPLTGLLVAGPCPE